MNQCGSGALPDLPRDRICKAPFHSTRSENFKTSNIKAGTPIIAMQLDIIAAEPTFKEYCFRGMCISQQLHVRNVQAQTKLC